MFKTKLVALDHPLPVDINCDDIVQFRNVVLWLEDQKIRAYKIEDREELRKVDSGKAWDQAYEKYRKDVNCPPQLSTHAEQLSWLLSNAIRLEYFDNIDKFKGITAESIGQSKTPNAPSVKSTNPFDNLDFSSKDFEAGIRMLANKLEIPYHPDHFVTLRALSRMIRLNLSNDALKEPILEGSPFPINDGKGFNYDDPNMEQAARILRLLQIQSVRQLQTAINETTTLVQELTADPKTDTKIGKVGF